MNSIVVHCKFSVYCLIAFSTLTLLVGQQVSYRILSPVKNFVHWSCSVWCC